MRETGKTYASALGVRDALNRIGANERVLFIVHREQIAKQAMKSYKMVFGNTRKFGLLSGNNKDMEADFLFSTMQMMAKEEVRQEFKKNHFYYLGRMYATGTTSEFVMANTDKTAVEIEWQLDTPVREDIYSYITSE